MPEPSNQQLSALELANRINREWTPEWHRGYGCTLRKPGSTQFGFIRRNVAGQNYDRFSVHVFWPFDDPEGRFVNRSTSAHQNRLWHRFVNPRDEEDIRYAVAVLESAYDKR